MMKELSEKVFVYKDLIEVFLVKNSSSSSSLNSRVIRIFLSKNCSRSEYDYSHVFLSLNDILNLKEFRIFKG